MWIAAPAGQPGLGAARVEVILDRTTGMFPEPSSGRIATPDHRSSLSRRTGDLRIRELRWCWLLAARQTALLGYRISPEAEIARLSGATLRRERARSRLIRARMLKWTGAEQWPFYGPAKSMLPNAIAEPPDPGLEQLRSITLYLSASAPPMRSTDGRNYYPEELPELPVLLIARIHEWDARYQWWCVEVDGGDPPECDPRFPAAAFNAEGRAIGRALKAALPRDWTVIVEDVDIWLNRSIAEEGCLVLPESER